MKDGRWGFLSIPIVDPNEADILGADVFGRMRSPWNVNDRMYLARGLGEMCGISTTDYCEFFFFTSTRPATAADPTGTAHFSCIVLNPPRYA